MTQSSSITDTCTVLIAAPEVLPALKQKTSGRDGELLAFTDLDALRAFETIITRRPAVVALERLFAASARGAALINRIRQDPSLAGSEIRVISHDADCTRGASGSSAVVEAAPAAETVAPRAASAAGSTASPAQRLDYHGTRRAPRYRIAGSAPLLVDGNQAMLVDLSTLGAQVVSPAVLKPNQRVRITISDDRGSTRFNAAVAWASFEIPPNAGPRYRAGVEFIEPDAPALEAFCNRHKAT